MVNGRLMRRYYYGMQNFWLIAAMPSSMVPLTDIPTLARSFSVAA